MILTHYLLNKIINNFVLIFSSLLLIMLGYYFCSYLTHAANEDMSINLVFPLFLLTIPRVILSLLDIGFFISIILTLNHLFNTQELWIYFSSGVSWYRLLRNIMIPAIFLSLIALVLSFYVVPYSLNQYDHLKQEYRSRSLLNITPGKFYTLTGNQSAYIQKNKEGSQASRKQNFFMAKLGQPNENTRIIDATFEKKIQENNDSYLLLKNGFVMDFTIGQKKTEKTHFDSGKIYIKSSSEKLEENISRYATIKLWHTNSHNAYIELQWRLITSLFPVFTAMTSVLLCRRPANSKQYHGIIFALLIFSTYEGAFSMIHGLLTSKTPPPWLNFWWPSLIMLLTVLYAYWRFDRNK